MRSAKSSSSRSIRLHNDVAVGVTGNVTLDSTGSTTASKAEIQDRAVVVAGDTLDMTGVKTLVDVNADLDVTGAVTMTAAGSASASDADIMSGVRVTAASLSQTAQNAAKLLSGAVIDVGGGNYEMAAGSAALCTVSGSASVTPLRSSFSTTLPATSSRANPNPASYPPRAGPAYPPG